MFKYRTWWVVLFYIILMWLLWLLAEYSGASLAECYLLGLIGGF